MLHPLAPCAFSLSYGWPCLKEYVTSPFIYGFYSPQKTLFVDVGEGLFFQVGISPLFYLQYNFMGGVESCDVEAMTVKVGNPD